MKPRRPPRPAEPRRRRALPAEVPVMAASPPREESVPLKADPPTPTDLSDEQIETMRKAAYT